MLLEPSTRNRLIRDWREIQHDPARLDRFRRHAMDIIVDGIDSSFELDPEYADLTDEEREEYLRFIADDLAWSLVRYIGFWVLNDFPRVVDWQSVRRVAAGDRPG